MNPRPALACILALACGATLAGPVLAAGPLAAVVAPGEPVLGLAQYEWAEAWWQWAYRFPLTSGPVADLTGEECGAGQSGPVWFLAGTYESEPVHRRCAIPGGKFIFLPVINYVSTWRNLDAAYDCDLSRNSALALTDPAMRLTAELDGLPLPELEAHRQTSRGCFNLARAVPDAAPILAASSGYWVMLRPLPPGRHSLRFGAVLPSLQQGVIYDLTIAGDPPR